MAGRRSFLLGAVAAIVVLPTQAFESKQIYVDWRFGDDTPNCGAKGSPCRTLKRAFGAGSISESTVVKMRPGAYLDECSLHGIAVEVHTGVALEIRADIAKRADGKRAKIDCGALGKALAFKCSGGANNITLTDLEFHGNFTGAIMKGEQNLFGGGLALLYGENSTGVSNTKVEGVQSQIENCHFFNNLLAATNSWQNSSDYAGALGGGVYASFGIVSNTRISFERCNFEKNNLQATCSQSARTEGGGAFIYFLKEAADASIDFSHCHFSENRLIPTGAGPTAAGGGLFSIFPAKVANVSTHLEYCSFISNQALTNATDGNNQGGNGGAIYMQTYTPASLSLLRCNVSKNRASNQGGGIYMEQDRPNRATNLDMSITESTQFHAFPFHCSAASERQARQWDFGNASLQLLHSTVSNNEVATSTSPQGGGLFALNVFVVIDSCAINGNLANSSGGGLYLEAGSAFLVLKGNTVLRSNIAHISGTAIFTASGGSIHLRDNATIEVAPRSLTGSAAEGLTLLSAGELTLSKDAQLQCSEGERFWFNVSNVETVFTEWQIDCHEVRSVDNGRGGRRVEFLQPTCRQLLVDKNKSAAAGDLAALDTYSADCLPLQPTMKMVTGTISCVPCSRGLYSLDHGHRIGNNTHDVDCLKCPYGADCSDGGSHVKVKAGFWGTQIHDQALGTQIAQIKLCPPEYCCTAPNGCVWNSNAACMYNRSQEYPLCGGCKSGFSQAIDGVGCVRDQDCGGRGVVLYMSVQICYWVGVAAYGLFASRYPPLLARLPRRLQPSQRNDGAMSVVIYFLQMAAVVVPQGYRRLVSQVMTTVGAAVNVEQLAGGSGGVCLRRGMTMIDKLAWFVFTPIMPMVLLALLVLLLRVRVQVSICASSAINSARTTRESISRRLSMDDGERTQPLLEVGAFSVSITPLSSTPAASAPTTGMAAGLACVMLLSFSSISTALFKLVNCERVNGERVLFFAGAKRCGLWQLPVYLVLAVLTLVPLVPVSVRALGLLPSSWRIKQWAREQRWPNHPVMQAIRAFALEPFKREWAAVLMLQRLSTVACHALAPSQLQSELGVAIVSVWFLLVQAVARPYRERWVNRLQLVACWCLVMLGVLNIATYSALVSVGVDLESTPFRHVGVDCDWMMFLLLWPPIIILAVYTPWP
eukprot:g2055.t1